MADTFFIGQLNDPNQVAAATVSMPVFAALTALSNFCSSHVFGTITIGAIPTVLNAGLARLIRTEGYAKQAGFGVAFGGVLNIVLDPIFILPFVWKSKGAAIATMLSNVAAMLYFFFFCTKYGNEQLLHQIRNIIALLATFPLIS